MEGGGAMGDLICTLAPDMDVPAFPAPNKSEGSPKRISAMKTAYALLGCVRFNTETPEQWFIGLNFIPPLPCCQAISLADIDMIDA